MIVGTSLDGLCLRTLQLALYILLDLVLTDNQRQPLVVNDMLVHGLQQPLGCVKDGVFVAVRVQSRQFSDYAVVFPRENRVKCR